MEPIVSSLLILEKINQFKAKVSEINKYSLCLGNISKGFTMENIKKNRIKRNYNFFLLIMNLLILMKYQISRFLMKKTLENNFWNYLKNIYCIISQHS